MASPKSREFGFYYGHPQNNFWRVIAAVFGCYIQNTVDAKKDFLLRNNIALWDVLQSCQISGADDSSIKMPVVNDFTEILSKSNIKSIFTTGMTATKLYKKYSYEKTMISSVYLPSTSPANRKNFDFDKLVREYKILVDYM
jgi:hypoxanthine-DNA glycosylase